MQGSMLRHPYVWKLPHLDAEDISSYICFFRASTLNPNPKPTDSLARLLRILCPTGALRVLGSGFIGTVFLEEAPHWILGNPFPSIFNPSTPPSIKCSQYIIVYHNGEYVIVRGVGGLMIGGGDYGVGIRAVTHAMSWRATCSIIFDAGKESTTHS